MLYSFPWRWHKFTFPTILKSSLFSTFLPKFVFLMISTLMGVRSFIVQSLSCIWLFATPWTAACQASLFFISPGVCSNSCPLSQWCHPTISSFVTPFSSCPQSFPATGAFPMSGLFTSGGQSIRASASGSVLTMIIQGWYEKCYNSSLEETPPPKALMYHCIPESRRRGEPLSSQNLPWGRFVTINDPPQNRAWYH